MQSAPTPSTRSRATIGFILLSAFVNLMGIGIITPVLPALTGIYTAPQDTVLVGSLLFTAYSLFQFISVPTLGALSDRFGRRPVLLVCFIGSAIGYLISGIGGTLFMLFLGRIIDGVTGGNIAAIYAYAADITDDKDRTRFFGLLGAFAGFGFVVGPALGGIVYRLTGELAAPFIFSALVTLITVIGIYFYMPESLSPERRDPRISLSKLNPLVQLVGVFRIASLRLLLIGIFLWMLPFAMLQANLGFLVQDQLAWLPDQVSLMFTLIGLVQIVVQGGVIRVLLRRMGEANVAIAGLLLICVGMTLTAITISTRIEPIIFIAIVATACGNALTIPTTTGLLSRAASMREQGRVQGGNQSVQALARVIGPVYGGWGYSFFGPALLYLSGAGLTALAAVSVVGSVRRIAAKRSEQPAVIEEIPPAH